MIKTLRYLFFFLVIYPVIHIVLGINVRNRHLLPTSGPAVLAANHNSHLDAAVLMALFPPHLINKVRPVGATDYWFSNRWIAWFSHKVMGIVPIDRERTEKGGDPLSASYEALAEGSILIFFPEGSRGEPEQLSDFKAGVTLLSERFPQAPVVPLFMYGMGKAWPKGARLFVPFFCHVVVGRPMHWEGERLGFMRRFKAEMRQLAASGNFPLWQ
ncbi:MAG: 1-acyl-sn-glycerol-3-phosphate acyltransferase [Caldilineaceae bacterium]|nr:1-acyl-sn-glycerol-3-phosphate acyltransferase [Caldilineaceae bacterium]